MPILGRLGQKLTHPMCVYIFDSASCVHPLAKPKSQSFRVGGCVSVKSVLSSFRSLHSKTLACTNNPSKVADFEDL